MHRLQFIESVRFVVSLLSNLVIDSAEWIHKIKYKYRHNDKKCETCRIRYKDMKFNVVTRIIKTSLTET